MKVYQPDDLHEENPELFDKIREGLELAMPHVYEEVRASLVDANNVAEHSTFLRLENTDDNTKYYVEVRTLHARVIDMIVSKLAKIILHDTIEEYYAERDRLSKGRRVKDYKGIKL